MAEIWVTDSLIHKTFGSELTHRKDVAPSRWQTSNDHLVCLHHIGFLSPLKGKDVHFTLLITRASSSNSSVFFLALSSTILSCSLFLWVRSSCRRCRSHSNCRWRSNSRLAAWNTHKRLGFISQHRINMKNWNSCITQVIYCGTPELKRKCWWGFSTTLLIIPPSSLSLFFSPPLSASPALSVSPVASPVPAVASFLVPDAHAPKKYKHREMNWPNKSAFLCLSKNNL